jgi:hypothetical protein
LGRASSRELWARLFTVVVASVAFGLLVEAGFRLLVPVSDIPHWKGDSCTGFRLVPKQEGEFVGSGHHTHFRINDRGWNDLRDYGKPGPGKGVRLALVGDSYVEALEVDVGQALGPRLEALFRERGVDLEVRSYGISGASTAYAKDLLECEVLADRPDFIVYLFINNDVYDSVDTGADHPPGPVYALDASGSPKRLRTVVYVPRGWTRFLSRFAVFRYFWINRGLATSWGIRHEQKRNAQVQVKLEASTGGVYQPPTPWWANAWEVAGGLIAQMKQRAEQQEAGFLVINRPHAANFYPTERFGDINMPEKQLAEQAQRRGFDFQDLHDWFERDWEEHHERFDFADDPHWGVNGHRVAALALADILAQRRPDLFAPPAVHPAGFQGPELPKALSAASAGHGLPHGS